MPSSTNLFLYLSRYRRDYYINAGARGRWSSVPSASRRQVSQPAALWGTTLQQRRLSADVQRHLSSLEARLSLRRPFRSLTGSWQFSSNPLYRPTADELFCSLSVERAAPAGGAAGRPEPPWPRAVTESVLEPIEAARRYRAGVVKAALRSRGVLPLRRNSLV